MTYLVTVRKPDRPDAARIQVEAGTPGEAVRRVLRVAHWLGAPDVAFAVCNEASETARGDGAAFSVVAELVR